MRRTLVVRRVCRTDDFQESVPHAHLEGAHCLNEYVQTLSVAAPLHKGRVPRLKVLSLIVHQAIM